MRLRRSLAHECGFRTERRQRLEVHLHLDRGVEAEIEVVICWVAHVDEVVDAIEAQRVIAEQTPSLERLIKAVHKSSLLGCEEAGRHPTLE
jgi:hypothetical protein